MVSKRNFLFLYVPGGLILGIGTLVLQIAAHGLSNAVIAGLVTGVALCLAVGVLIRDGLRRPLQGQALREARQAGLRTHRVGVSAGLALATTATVFGLTSGSAKPFLLAAIGVIFTLLTPVAAYGAWRGRGLYS